MHIDNTSHDEPIADADLILRARSGDSEAFGELWRRHYPAGLSVARSVTSSIDPDDLVQEAYTRIYQAILKGAGPNGSFRAYLFTSIRNTAAAWGRSRRETAIDELDSVADPDSTEQAANEALDRSLTAQAFRSLPSRWQEVLWYTEIEQMKPQEVAPLLGMKAGAVSQLAFRAREGLREAWIQAHLRSAEPGSDCQWAIEHLGAYARGNLGTRDHKRLEQHLDECARCMIVAAEAKDVSTRLALVLLPLVLGVTGAAGYLATIQGGGTPIVALAAMPSSVCDGAVVMGDGGASSASNGSSGSAGSAGGGGGIGSGGILSGVGALVGAGSAALVVAGVVAAAAIVPSLAGTAPVASLPSAGEQGAAAITSEVGPDEAMSLDAPLVIEDPAPIPQPVPEEPAPPVDVPTVQQTGPTVAAPTIPVIAPVLPMLPVDPVPKPEPEPEPGLPEGIPEVVSAEVTCVMEANDILIATTHYWVQVKGAPGATVQALLGGTTAGTTGAVLDATGTGLVDLRPTFLQLLLNVRVSFQYTLTAADGTLLTGPPTEPRGIWELADPTGIACGGPEEPPAGEVPVEQPGGEPAAEQPVDAAVAEAPTVDEAALQSPQTASTPSAPAPSAPAPAPSAPAPAPPAPAPPVAPVQPEAAAPEPSTAEPVTDAAASDPLSATEAPVPAE